MRIIYRTGELRLYWQMTVAMTTGSGRVELLKEGHVRLLAAWESQITPTEASEFCMSLTPWNPMIMTAAGIREACQGRVQLAENHLAQLARTAAFPQLEPALASHALNLWGLRRWASRPVAKSRVPAIAPFTICKLAEDAERYLFGRTLCE